MKILDLRNVDWKGSVKAVFSVQVTVMTANNQTVTFIIKDLKLIDGTNGMFVASPSVKYEKDGETKYKNILDFSPEFQSMITEEVSRNYDSSQEYNKIYSEKTEYKERGTSEIPN